MAINSRRRSSYSRLLKEAKYLLLCRPARRLVHRDLRTQFVVAFFFFLIFKLEASH